MKKLVKKKINWADENDLPLEHISFFETNFTEILVMHGFSRLCAANMSTEEIEAFLQDNFNQLQNFYDTKSDDDNVNQDLPPLPKLIPILLPDNIRKPIVQNLSEEECHPSLDFSTLPFLPDSPSEPNMDLFGNVSIEPQQQPKLIPLNDVRIRIY